VYSASGLPIPIPSACLKNLLGIVADAISEMDRPIDRVAKNRQGYSLAGGRPKAVNLLVTCHDTADD
jgi:hypothetical protein